MDAARLGERCQHARDRDTGAQPTPYLAAIVQVRSRIGEVGRNAEERERQIFDPQVAEGRLQQPRHASATEQRHQRHRVVAERVGRHKGTPKPFIHLGVCPARGGGGRYDRTHAGSTGQVDRNAGGSQRLHGADMREAAGTAAGHHHADRRSGQQPREAVDIAGRIESHMVVWAKGTVGQQCCGGAGCRVARIVQQHELAPALEDFARRLSLQREGQGRGSGIVGAAQHDQTIGLTQTEAGPVSVARIGAIDDVRRFGFASTEPLRPALSGFRPQHLRIAAASFQCRRERHSEARRRHVVPHGQKRERAWLASLVGWD